MHLLPQAPFPMQLSTPMPTSTSETDSQILTPDTSRGTEARRLTPDTVATAPAARRGEGSGRPLGGSCSRGCARGTGADGSNRGSRLAGLRSRGEIARGGSAGWAGGAGSALGSNRVVKDPVRGSRGLGAGCALRARGRLGRRAVGVASRAWGTSITSRRGAADAIKGQGRVSTNAGGSARTRGARADVTSLINISGLFSERSLAVQGAALAGDQVPSLLLRHVLVAREGQLGKDGYVEKLLAQAQQTRRGLHVCSGEASEEERKHKRRPANNHRPPMTTIFFYLASSFGFAIVGMCYTVEGGLLRWYCCSVCRFRSSRSR